jgi:hypothetical protein
MRSRLNTVTPALYLLLVLFIMVGYSASAQHEELKQNIDAFVDAKSTDFEKKYLNEKEPDYGELANTNFDFHDFFELRANEKTENNIGNNVRLKLQCSFYGYENETERNYALSFWFKNFIQGKRITPGRTVRTYQGAEPTIIIINEDHIVVISFACTSYDPDLFRDLRKELVAFFGNVDSMVAEINCDGPLDWTKNAPDPKDRKWRM